MSSKEIAKVRTGINWETSRIREWLNRDFFQEAFTKEEQNRILIKEVKTPISTFSDQVTYDRVFLPSIEEVNGGFDVHAIRGTNSVAAMSGISSSLTSQYAAAKMIDETLPSGYGLRTRGTINYFNDTFTYGENCDGHSIQNGKLACWGLNIPMGIRPVIQVDVTDVVEV
ncbi:MAG: DUF6273 domain-containing protein [Lachnospiraceae bacterium]|nr:DUF6273 domain-containing protein [Lachnospiraceae bacterium]